jgi:hypothetical protein
MSPNDRYFLKSLGIKPEEIQPAKETGVYETCPKCAGRHVRNLKTGNIFCLSCLAREWRDFERDQALQLANNLKAAGFREPIVPYRGWQIAHLSGTGWCYRLAGDNIFGHWMKAKSLHDAELRIERYDATPPEEPDEPIVPANKCRECGEPCGQMEWCGPCGKAKFL